MHIVGTCTKISFFLMVVFLASISTAQSQDVFRELNQVKSDVATLKSEVNDLKRLVFELRKVVLEDSMASGRQAGKKTGAEGRKKEAITRCAGRRRADNQDRVPGRRAIL